jgi:N-methylhydantoinase B
MDTIVLDILWSRLINIATEQMKALLHSAFSTIVRESEDCATGIFDATGTLLAQAPSGAPGQINSMATWLANFLEVFPVASLHPGDVLITNDPWKAAGHLNDITVVSPVFRGSKVVSFFGSCAHAVDIGGRGFGADSRSVYEEGLFIPISKLFHEGRPNDLLINVIRDNVRSADLVIGDILAQVTCNTVGSRRLQDLMDEFGLTDLNELSDEIVSRTENALRAAIAEIPTGRYGGEVWCDGFDSPIVIRCTIDVTGSDLLIDFGGSSLESPQGINVPLCYTASYASYAVKCMLAPDVPNNAGSFRPIKVTAPEGSILNARRPAAVGGRHIIGNFQPLAIYAALSGVASDKVIACSSVLWILTLARESGAGEFTATFFASGGMGARPSKDGLSATSFPGNIAMTSIEMLESVAPVLIHEKSLLADSAGAGRHRGGLGQRIRIGVRDGGAYVLTPIGDQTGYSPYGLAGGRPGQPGSIALSTGETLNPKAKTTVPAGVDVVISLPGGGGIGDPRERHDDQVRHDAEQGLITPGGALRDYGINLDSDDQSTEKEEQR